MCEPAGKGKSKKRVSCTLSLLLFFTVAGFAAETIADLEKQLPNAQGQPRVDLLNQLSFSYWSKDPKVGMSYGRQALDLSRELKYEKGMARAFNCLGLNSYFQGGYGDAIDYYKQSIEMSRASDDKQSMANTLNNLGKIYGDLGSHDLALQNYFESLKVKEEVKDSYGTARVLNNIGEVYLELNRYDDALGFFQRSLAMKKMDNKDQEGLATAYQNLGGVYLAKKDYKAALDLHNRSLLISEKIGKKSGVGDSQFAIGEVLIAQGNYKKALESYLQSLRIREELGDKRGIAACLNHIGGLRTGLGEYSQAQLDLDKALRIAQELSNKQEMISSWLFLSDLANAKGDWMRALQCLKNWGQIKDQVYTQESSQKIANLSILYENQQKQQQIELQRLKIGKQQQLGYFMIIIIGLVLLSMFIVYNRYRLKVHVNRELERMNTQLDLLTRTDPLTQLSNRRDFIEKMRGEIVRYMRSRKTFSVVLGDIDDFKRINDLYGHECGDYVLVTVAQLLRETARQQDAVARWGGEEFTMLLPETDLQGGQVLSMRICDKIARHRFEFNGRDFQVTMTFGVAAYIEGLRIEDCISQADTAMYTGKTAGKNRVILQGA